MVLAGEVGEGLLAELGRSGNVSVARAPEAGQQERAQPRPAWRDKRFELPDYYLVVADAPAEGMGQDLYLGPLRAEV